mmetsp:Transcript_56530/g.132579  ORF Transcript_56530/g.132579 Transcript_56530/m.132579 type:complete len:215 (-) Transcript_56530:1444-2088(-)
MTTICLPRRNESVLLRLSVTPRSCLEKAIWKYDLFWNGLPLVELQQHLSFLICHGIRTDQLASTIAEAEAATIQELHQGAVHVLLGEAALSQFPLHAALCKRLEWVNPHHLLRILGDSHRRARWLREGNGHRLHAKDGESFSVRANPAHCLLSNHRQYALKLLVELTICQAEVDKQTMVPYVCLQELFMFRFQLAESPWLQCIWEASRSTSFSG